MFYIISFENFKLRAFQFKTISHAKTFFKTIWFVQVFPKYKLLIFLLVSKKK